MRHDPPTSRSPPPRTVRRGAGTVHPDLRLPSHWAKLADPEHYFRFRADRLVVLDEIRRAAGFFEVLGTLSTNVAAGVVSHSRFRLPGPASIDLLRQSSGILIGRIAIHEPAPPRLEESAGDFAPLLDHARSRAGHATECGVALQARWCELKSLRGRFGEFRCGKLRLSAGLGPRLEIGRAHV